MKTMHHGEQTYWVNHRPNVKDWFATLQPGDPVKIQRKYQGKRRVSLSIYTFSRLMKGPNPAVSLRWLGYDVWCYVINKHGKEISVLRSTLVPTNRVNDPIQPKEKQ